VNHHKTILENIESALSIDEDDTETTDKLVKIHPEGRSIGEAYE
jgi:hypothetical protein